MGSPATPSFLTDTAFLTPPCPQTGCCEGLLSFETCLPCIQPPLGVRLLAPITLIIC